MNENGISPPQQVYPNPTSGELIVEIRNKTAGKPYDITIFDVLGRELKRIVTKSGKTNMDISKHPAGLYLVQIRGEKAHYIRRIVCY